MFKGETYERAHKWSIEDQRKAKFNFSGATLYGINAVIGSSIFLLPQKNLCRFRISFSSCHVQGSCSRHAACLAETAGSLRQKTVEPCNTQKARNFIRLTSGFGWRAVIAQAAMLAVLLRSSLLSPALKAITYRWSIVMLVLLSIIDIAGLKTSKMFTPDQLLLQN